MNVCEVNSILVEKLHQKNQSLLQADEDLKQSNHKRIDDNYDNIKAVLLTICGCTDTNRLDYYFGNKRKIHPSLLIDCVESFIGGDEDQLRYKGIVRDKYFLNTINEITKDLWGITYRLNPPEEMFGSYTYKWNDETFGEWNSEWWNIMCEWCKTPVVLFIVMFFWISIPFAVLVYILQLIEDSKRLKWSLNKRSKY